MDSEPLRNRAVELAELELKLRIDLDFSMQDYGGTKYYILEDRGNSRFYQIGLAEYRFISLLDGRTSLSEALRLTATKLGPDAFTEQNAVAIVKWLVDCQLVTTAEITNAERVVATAENAEKRSRVSRLNPLILKIPLFNPERFLDGLSPWLGWMTSSAAMVGWCVLCVMAIHCLLGNSEQLVETSQNVFARSNWLCLALTWLVLKFFHEIGHALTCRRFGGQVRDCGVMLILFAPIPYVDVTSSWRFASKWQRVAVSGAGMFVELGLAAVAGLVWSFSDDPLVVHHAYNVMLLGSITTFVFNANFLMRFDGYYMLADWLEIPNLYTLGQQYLSYVARRYAMGVKLDSPRWRKAALIKAYGVTSLAWRVFVCACLVIAAQGLFFGFGMVLSVAGVALWLGVPLYRFARYLCLRRGTERPNLVHFGSVCACLAAFVVAAFTVIPWPGRVSAPAIVRYAASTRVHCEAAGFVEQVHAQPGQFIQKGQLLIELANPGLELELNDLELAIEQSKIRRRSYYLRSRLAAYQAEASVLEALETRAAEMRSQIRALQIRAPQSGIIVARELDSLRGRHLSIGSEVLTIANEDCKEIVLSIQQDDVPHFRSQVGRPVTVCLSPPLSVDCRLDLVKPQASIEVTEPALVAVAGGPIAVRQATLSDSLSLDWLYLSPRFEGTTRLSPEQSRQLHVGQRATIKLSARRGTLGGNVLRVVRDWFLSRTPTLI